MNKKKLNEIRQYVINRYLAGISDEEIKNGRFDYDNVIDFITNKIIEKLNEKKQHIRHL